MAGAGRPWYHEPAVDDSDSVLLLSCRNQVEADLARNLLEKAGIPCYLAGPDFDFVELGRSVHSMLRGADVRVLAADVSRARAVLEEAWGRPV